MSDIGTGQPVAVELFSCLAEAQVLIEDWRIDYNEHRPHSALGMLTPAAFATAHARRLTQATETAAGEEGDHGHRAASTHAPAQPRSHHRPERQTQAVEVTPG